MTDPADNPTPEELHQRSSERAKRIIASIRAGDPEDALKEAQALLVDLRTLGGGGDVTG